MNGKDVHALLTQLRNMHQTEALSKLRVLAAFHDKTLGDMLGAIIEEYFSVKFPAKNSRR